MSNASYRTADKIIAAYKEHYRFPWQGESHMHDCICTVLEEQRDELLTALRDLADRDWGYTGDEADITNPDSLYNRVARARMVIKEATR